MEAARIGLLLRRKQLVMEGVKEPMKGEKGGGERDKATKEEVKTNRGNK